MPPSLGFLFSDVPADEDSIHGIFFVAWSKAWRRARVGGILGFREVLLGSETSGAAENPILCGV